jgi:hypothetical protein
MALYVWYDGKDLAENFGITKNILRTDEDIEELDSDIDKEETRERLKLEDIDADIELMESEETQMQKKFLDLAKQAEETKNAVDASIKKMDLDSVMRNESYDHEQAMKAIKTAAGVTLGAAGGSLLVGGALGLSSAMKKNPEVRDAVKQFDIKEPIDSSINIIQSTNVGKKGYEAVDTALRTYFDARAYVVAVGLDEANERLTKQGVYDHFGKSIGGGLKTAQTESGWTPERVTEVSGNIKQTSSNLAKISNSPAARQFIESGQQTVTQALSNPQVAGTLNNLNEINYQGAYTTLKNDLSSGAGYIDSLEYKPKAKAIPKYYNT